MSAQSDSTSQQELVSRIVQRVASGVLDIPADGQATRAQQQTIDRVTRQLVNDLDLFRAEEQMLREREQEQKDRATRVKVNIAKGIAIVIALLILRAIILAIGRGVAAEDSGATMSVFVAARSDDEANAIGRALIDDHLAARGTILSPLSTIARGEEGIESSDGVLLTLKTTQTNVPAIISYIVEKTPAPVPDVVALPRSLRNDPDLDWVHKPDKGPWWKRLMGMG